MKLVRNIFFILLSLIIPTYKVYSDSLNEKHFRISKISIEGNKQTKEFIIKREITFNIGDSLSESELQFQIEKSKQNLLKTSLFNYVTIDSKYNSLQEAEINVLVEERWYTFPSFTLDYVERNFSEWLKQGDIARTNYGGAIVRHNFRGRNEKVKFSILLGYTKKFSLSYNNIIFGDKKQHYFGGEIALLRDDELTYKTENNKPVRYKNENRHILERRKATINYSYRPKFYNKHKVYLNYYQYFVDDTISILNDNFFSSSLNRFDQITLHYIFTQDKRDSKAYPLRGHKFELFFEQTSGISDKFSLTYIKPKFKYHKELSKRFYYASGVTAKVSRISSNSYYNMRALGYDDNLKGYEPFIIDGQHFLLVNNLFKTVVLPTRITEISFLPVKKFNKIHYAIYLNVYFDIGYVKNKYALPVNTLDNAFLYSYGLGFDLVTYYDKVFRVEYSINRNAVKGLYIHLKAPI